MPKKIKIEPHLGSEELEDRYRKAHDPVLRSHYQIVWLISEGKTTRQVMEVTGYLRKALAAFQRRGCKPPLRGDRGVGGGARGALCGFVRPTRAHPLLHPLPLVAGGGVRTKAIQTDLV
jgi:hypothetical protein